MQEPLIFVMRSIALFQIRNLAPRSYVVDPWLVLFKLNFRALSNDVNPLATVAFYHIWLNTILFLFWQVSCAFFLYGQYDIPSLTAV